MIVFLDISGPLLTESSAARSQAEGLSFPRFNPRSVKLINRQLALSGAEVVVSSNFALQGRRVIERWFAFNELTARFHPDWTSSTFMGAPRDGDIKQWLAAHPEIANYAIIDDIEMPAGPLRQRQAHVTDWNGFSDENDRELGLLLKTPLI